MQFILPPLLLEIALKICTCARPLRHPSGAVVLGWARVSSRAGKGAGGWRAACEEGGPGNLREPQSPALVMQEL